MKPIKRIDEPNCRRYQLDLHTDYLQRLYDVISKIGPEKILLDASDIVTWDTGLKEQGEITREIKASEESESLVIRSLAHSSKTSVAPPVRPYPHAAKPVTS